MEEHNVFDNEEPRTEPMTFEEAKQFLAKCKRMESRDHTFGDREVYWTKDDVEVADGYFASGGIASVYVFTEQVGSSFRGEEARELVKCGVDVVIGRNDETGPDRYMGA